MSYLVVDPELLVATAADVAGISSTLSAANAAAAAPTTGLAALGIDEISAAINGFLSLQARQYQAISAQVVAAVNARIAQALSAGAQWYAGTETAIATSLRGAEQQLQGVV
ncbi:PE family protein, partial [Mycobacterium gordonae]